MTSTLTGEDVVRAAAWLHDAERDRAPIPPLTETMPGLDLATAYAVQRAGLRTRLAAGATLRGHKIGLTAAAMRQLLGVDEPDYGYLLDTMLCGDGARLAVDRFCAPRVEPEVAFRLRSPLSGPGVTAADVLAATDALAPALEVVDSRIADWRITLADTVADNASSAAVVLGEWVPLSYAGPPVDLTAELVVNGDVVGTGTGAEVLGDPANAIAWLANALAAFDVTIEAGHIVIPGSFTSAVFVHAGDTATARFPGLGEVTADFTAGAGS